MPAYEAYVPCLYSTGPQRRIWTGTGTESEAPVPTPVPVAVPVPVLKVTVDIDRFPVTLEYL
jgi:hypothetical protein